jgi:hypothetical protein
VQGGDGRTTVCEVRERPILCNGEQVRAILAGTQTVTRRVIQPRIGGLSGLGFWGYDTTPEDQATVAVFGDTSGYHPQRIRCPYGQPGDRLWVRETWNCIDTGRLTQRQDWVRYRATDGDEMYWRPSIHMPRWASRITLEVASVRVERVQDITSEDAMHEGITAPLLNDKYSTMRGGFSILWDEINAKRGYSWDSNPWVWCISFKEIAS